MLRTFALIGFKNSRSSGNFDYEYRFLAEGMPDGGYEKAAFDGGFYLTYFYWDHDEEENRRLYQEAVEYIEGSGIFELDERPGHYSMGHIITPPEAIQALGKGMMEAFVPVKLKTP